MSFIDTSWSVSPTVFETRFFGPAAVGAAGAVALSVTDCGLNGVGYKIFMRSAGNSSARTWTIVGHKVGTLAGVSTSEVVTAPNAAAVVSVNYYDTIVSITASGAMTGNQSLGVGDVGGTGTLTTMTLPLTRIIGCYYVGAAGAGSIVITRNSLAAVELLRIATPVGAATTMYVDTGAIRTAGSAALTDYALVTPTAVIFYTLFCG